MKLKNMKPELLWESKNKNWQIYLDKGRFTIDNLATGYVFYPLLNPNGSEEFPNSSEIPKYVKDRFLKIRKKHSPS